MPYYYGYDKWDRYLTDIPQSIEAGTLASQRNSELLIDAFEAGLERQLDENREQTEQLLASLEGMRSQFEWGFTLMADRMDSQIRLLSNMANELSAIHQTLKSPLLTQAQEYFDIGNQHLQEGLRDRR